MSVLSLISLEMDNSQLVAKSHIEDFNTKSQLVVNESQEALFYKDGQALDLFAAGRHSLDTANLPIFKRIFGKLFGTNTPFTCEVFFINKVSVLDIYWGTDTPILVEDPKYNLLVHVRANGQTGIHVKDSRKFVVKVVGQLKEFTVDSVRRTIKGMLISNIKEVIASAIIEKGISILDITSKLGELNELITAKINERIDSIGLEVENFYIGTLLGDDGDLDKLREMKERRLEVMTEAELEAFKMTTLSQARAKARAMEGYTYQEERHYDVLEGAAKNESSAGGFVNMGVGLGMGVGVSREVGKMMTDSTAQAQQQQQIQNTPSVCPNCQNPVAAGAKFCPNCGTSLEVKVSFCSNCGTKCDPNAMFCSTCGNKLK
ncbi:MAG: SPFH domain-containing protein [Clostridiales bacterium]|nr:SPFH domain-containing protein [Clostridiales bacterium]